MTRCVEGHLFDPEKHTSCPWCGTGMSGGAGMSGVSGFTPGAVPENPGKTVALRPARQAAAPPPPPPASPNAPTVGSVLPGGDDAALSVHKPTERLIKKAIGINPVVGWVVCVAGPMRGQDFTLHSEKNFIGRDPSMDVALSSDTAVSRDKHASIVFEPKKHSFWLIPGDASGLVYLNGELVNGPCAMSDRDVVEVGESKLMLVTFVSERFRWEAGEKAS